MILAAEAPHFPFDADASQDIAFCDERRSFPRLKLALPGRYMTADGDERACYTVDVAAGGLRLRSDRRLKPGERIVAYIRDLGRIEGLVVRAMPDGFAFVVCGTPRKLERLVAKIDWVQRKISAQAEDRRILSRTDLDGRLAVRLRAGEREWTAQLLDISATGVALRVSAPLRIGERVAISDRAAVVTRLFEGGVAAAFD